MSDWIDEQGYRANVGIVLMRDDGRVFLGGRTGGRGWQFPQGGIRPDEPFEAALYRELEEEIGLAVADVELLGETRGWLRYKLPRQYVRRNGMPRCIGQKQRWALLRLRGDERRLRFDATDEPPEFDRFRWAEFWDPVREVIFFKRGVYQRALHELGRIAFPGGLPPYPSWWAAEAGPMPADDGAEDGGPAPAAG
ncbi:MAG TPA: RNA pyrophosphohydrolase [Steroidobacteraceae bacterium]|nr:RNA pyrophosphohydrolase [Steroidobacteraceae bacterium]